MLLSLSGLAKPVEDMLHHLGGEGALIRGVAQFFELAGEVGIQTDPSLQFPPGSIRGEHRTIKLCQLSAAIFSWCLIHTTNILIFSDLCKYFEGLFHVIYKQNSSSNQTLFASEIAFNWSVF